MTTETNSIKGKVRKRLVIDVASAAYQKFLSQVLYGAPQGKGIAHRDRPVAGFSSYLGEVVCWRR